jgi:hypothetical protein
MDKSASKLLRLPQKSAGIEAFEVKPHASVKMRNEERGVRKWRVRQFGLQLPHS